MKALLTLLFIVTTWQNSFACDCIYSTMDSAFKKSDLIVKGVILTRRTISRDVSLAYIDSFQTEHDERFKKDQKILEYDILVEKIYKGKLTNDTLKLRTYLPGNCHLELEVGSSYLVFSYRIPYLNRVYDNNIDSNTFHSSLCSSTTKFRLKEEIELERIRKN
jgi:hypothetical protein